MNDVYVEKKDEFKLPAQGLELGTCKKLNRTFPGYNARQDKYIPFR